MAKVDSMSLYPRGPRRPVPVDRNWVVALHLALLLWTSLWYVPGANASSRLSTDIVYMKNGDKMTCEIRSLSQGQLTIKQPYASTTVVLNWKEIDRIETNQPFVVVDTEGHSISGHIEKEADEDLVTVIGANTLKIPHDDVVSIQQTGETFIRRMQGNIDIGTNITQSNSQKNLTLQSDLIYQATKSYFSLSASSQVTSQQKTNNTNETSLNSEYFYQLRKVPWYGGAIANFLSSSEQKIDLRSTFGGAIAVRPIFTNKTNLSFIGGLGYTIEKDASDTTSTASTHALDSAVAVQFSTFRFDSTTFSTILWVYPSLTTPGRVRMTLNQDVYYKFYKDFYIRASFFNNYDNRPVQGAPSNNLGITSTIGWSFR